MNFILIYCIYLKVVVGNEIHGFFGRPIRDAEGYRNTELVLVHLIARHGDRVPSPLEILVFPNSPAANSTFYPYGIGALTNAGKVRNYQLGEFIRSRYGENNFLNSVYLTEELFAYADDGYPRTKMTMLGMLAGLYPPEAVQQYDPCLCWQPIPYDTLPRPEDETVYVYSQCPRFWAAFDEAATSAELLARFAPYQYLYKIVSQRGGGNVTKLDYLYRFNYCIKGLQNYGIPPPDWVLPLQDDLESALHFYFEALFYTDEQIKLAAGPFLHTMVKNCRLAMNSTVHGAGPGKMQIFSLHDSNIAALLVGTRALVPRGLAPEYGSALAIELRRDRATGEYGVTIMYLDQAGSGRPPVYLEIRDCGEFCPFDRFVDTISENMKTFEEIKQMCGNTKYLS